MAAGGSFCSASEHRFSASEGTSGGRGRATRRPLAEPRTKRARLSPLPTCVKLVRLPSNVKPPVHPSIHLYNYTVIDVLSPCAIQTWESIVCTELVFVWLQIELARVLVSSDRRCGRKGETYTPIPMHASVTASVAGGCARSRLPGRLDLRLGECNELAISRNRTLFRASRTTRFREHAGLWRRRSASDWGARRMAERAPIREPASRCRPLFINLLFMVLRCELHREGDERMKIAIA